MMLLGCGSSGPYMRWVEPHEGGDAVEAAPTATVPLLLLLRLLLLLQGLAQGGSSSGVGEH